MNAGKMGPEESIITPENIKEQKAQSEFKKLLSDKTKVMELLMNPEKLAIFLKNSPPWLGGGIDTKRISPPPWVPRFTGEPPVVQNLTLNFRTIYKMLDSIKTDTNLLKTIIKNSIDTNKDLDYRSFYILEKSIQLISQDDAYHLDIFKKIQDSNLESSEKSKLLSVITHKIKNQKILIHLAQSDQSNKGGYSAYAINNITDQKFLEKVLDNPDYDQFSSKPTALSRLNNKHILQKYAEVSDEKIKYLDSDTPDIKKQKDILEKMRTIAQERLVTLKQEEAKKFHPEPKPPVPTW